MMDAAIHAVDDKTDALAEFIVEPLADHLADDRLRHDRAMQDIAAECALLAPISKRAIDRLDDVAALTQFAQRGLQPLRERPDARLALGCEPVPLQVLQPADEQCLVEIGAELAGVWSQIEPS